MNRNTKILIFALTQVILFPMHSRDYKAMSNNYIDSHMMRSIDNQIYKPILKADVLQPQQDVRSVKNLSAQKSQSNIYQNQTILNKAVELDSNKAVDLESNKVVARVPSPPLLIKRLPYGADNINYNVFIPDSDKVSKASSSHDIFEEDDFSLSPFWDSCGVQLDSDEKSDIHLSDINNATYINNKKDIDSAKNNADDAKKARIEHNDTAMLDQLVALANNDTKIKKLSNGVVMPMIMTDQKTDKILPNLDVSNYVLDTSLSLSDWYHDFFYLFFGGAYDFGMPDFFASTSKTYNDKRIKTPDTQQKADKKAAQMLNSKNNIYGGIVNMMSLFDLSLFDLFGSHGDECINNHCSVMEPMQVISSKQEEGDNLMSTETNYIGNNSYANSYYSVTPSCVFASKSYFYSK